MSKLDIIWQLKRDNSNDDKFILKLENHCLELMNFSLLQKQNRYIKPEDLEISMSRCKHTFEFLQNCQTRAGDEAFTSIYLCRNCNYRKYIS